MTYEKIDIHPINLQASKLNLKKYSPTESEYKKALKWLETKAIDDELSHRRQVRVLYELELFFKIYKKPTDKISREELMKLKDDFLNKRILKVNDEPYSEKVIEGLTETIVNYLEDTQPKRMSQLISERGKPMRSWFIMRAKRKTPEILTEQEIKKLYNSCNLLWHKYTIAVLFGSGARIEEFLNLRFEDIEEPTKNFPYYQIDIKEEYSKTLGRKIGLYWEYCTEATAKYLASIEKKNPKDRVLDIDYDTVRMFLSRLGMKVLNKRIHAHMFRKSSATFHASKFNRQQLCKRFGWRFNSNVVDVYISRAGIDEVEVKDVMLDDDVSILRQKNKELETKFNLQEKELLSIKAMIKEMQEHDQKQRETDIYLHDEKNEEKDKNEEKEFKMIESIKILNARAKARGLKSPVDSPL